MAKAKALDATGHRKFGWLDKFSYAAGDFGCNMSFALKSYLTIFWTQFMGINQLAMAGLLLLVQIWDAINDPLIGAMVDADKHKYKRNKFLAYINVGAIGLTVAGALCFLPFPGMPEIVKMIMFVAGYIIWDAFYTVANVPYGSMLSLITDDPGQRGELSSFRSAGSMVAGIFTGILVPVLVYDASNNLLGDRMFWFALILGGIGLLFFQFMIRTTEIRVDTEVKAGEEAPKFNVLVALKNFFRNRAAVGATLSAVATFIGMYGAQTATTVLFQAYFKNAQISGLVGMISYLGLFLFMPFVKNLVTKVGKKEGCTIGGCVTCLAYLLMFVAPITPDGKERNEGTTYAMHSFFRKLAQGVGPSLGIVLATMVGYDATLGAAQPAAVALNMRYLTPAMYLLAGVLSVISYGLIYNLDRKTLNQMKTDLEARHAQG